MIVDDTILDLWGTGPNRPPVDSHHPAVRTHPVTGLRALNVNPGFVTDFAELKKKESGTYSASLRDLLANHPGEQTSSESSLTTIYILQTTT